MRCSKLTRSEKKNHRDHKAKCSIEYGWQEYSCYCYGGCPTCGLNYSCVKCGFPTHQDLLSEEEKFFAKNYYQLWKKDAGKWVESFGGAYTVFKKKPNKNENAYVFQVSKDYRP
jgi:hypothetical protein